MTTPMLAAILDAVSAVTLHIFAAPEYVGRVQEAVDAMGTPDGLTVDVQPSTVVGDGQLVYWITSTMTGEVLGLGE